MLFNLISAVSTRMPADSFGRPNVVGPALSKFRFSLIGLFEHNNNNNNNNHLFI